MALVIGHSQTKYLSEYLFKENFSVYSFPGAKTLDYLDKDYLFDVAQYFSVSTIFKYIQSSQGALNRPVGNNDFSA